MILYDENFEGIMDFYQSGDTERWHTKKLIPGQSVKDHSFGMLLLCEKLHPTASANLLRAIIRHDLAEYSSFDAPHDLKEEFPVLREIDDIKTEQFNSEHGLFNLNLTEDEELWLKFLDGLDVLAYIIAYVVPNFQASDIVKRQTVVTEALEQKLKARGYLQVADETIH